MDESKYWRFCDQLRCDSRWNSNDGPLIVVRQDCRRFGFTKIRLSFVEVSLNIAKETRTSISEHSQHMKSASRVTLFLLMYAHVAVAIEHEGNRDTLTEDCGDSLAQNIRAFRRT